MQIFKAHGLNSRGLFLLKFDFPLLKFHILLMKFHILLIILYSPSPGSHYCLFYSQAIPHPGFKFRPPSGIHISSAIRDSYFVRHPGFIFRPQTKLPL